MNPKNTVGIFLLLFLWPAWVWGGAEYWEHFQDQQQTSLDLSAEIESLEKRQATLTASETESGTSNTEILRKIPTKLRQAAMIRWVESTIQSTGLELQSGLSFARGVHPQVGVRQLQVSFTLLGQRDRLVDFLERVENDERFLGVESFAWQTETLPTGESQTTLNVQLYAFSQE